MSSSQIYSASDLLTSYLTFISISKNHDGRYRCELLLSNSSTVSHYINISVSGNYFINFVMLTNKIMYSRQNQLC